MVNFKEMSYVEFISFIKETNRCPGGKDTINWILKNSFATRDSNILEIGSNTGFSSLEVARVLKCKVLGIDIIPEAVKVSQEELQKDTAEIKKLVEFKVASAYDIPCSDNSIDLIIAGGSTSFMNKKERAIQEMNRVLKPWGFLSVTNLFYHTKPPKKVLDDVSQILGVRIEPMTAAEWINIYKKDVDFELYKVEKVNLSNRPQKEIDNYIEYFMKKPHITILSDEEKKELKEKWKAILTVFNENHKYLGFIRALFRKRYLEEEPELFRLKQ